MQRRTFLTGIVSAACSSPAWAQKAAKREPDVPYVPTTEEAVAAMLKLAEVKQAIADFERMRAKR